MHGQKQCIDFIKVGSRLKPFCTLTGIEKRFFISIDQVIIIFLLQNFYRSSTIANAKSSLPQYFNLRPVGLKNLICRIASSKKQRPRGTRHTGVRSSIILYRYALSVKHFHEKPCSVESRPELYPQAINITSPFFHRNVSPCTGSLMSAAQNKRVHVTKNVS